jgi:tetratricopeptide (TPR) repeat protein
VRGFHAPEVEQTYTRVRTLFREVGDELPRLELSFWGSFAYSFARGKSREAHEVGELLVALGERQGNQELLANGHRMMATDFFTWGEMPRALRHVRKALEGTDYELERHRALAVRDWVNPRVAVLAYGSVILSVLGQADEAERFAREALELSGRIGHPHTTLFALTYCSLGGQLRGDASTTLALTEQCIPLARESRFPLWFMWSSVLKSWALSELGRPRDGLNLLRETLVLWKHSGLQAGWHHNLTILAGIHLKLGQVEEGLAAVQEALTWPPKTDEYSYLPEIHRMRGELLRRAGREQEAREEFLEAIHYAREHEMRAYEERAQASLRRQLQEWGPHEAEAPGPEPMHP